LNFEWDSKKADANLQKHGTSFHDAATVFGDPLSTTFPDPDRSRGEARYVTIGASKNGALLVVSHTERDDAIRIISARPATRHERKFYEEEN
jgi:hypothetical protein